MKFIKKYKYNELEYAKIIYENGFTGKYLATEMRLLVIYYRDVLGLKPKERKIKLYEFCEKYIYDFERALFYKTINKALRDGGKKSNRLLVVDKICIYENEINYLNSLNIEFNMKKVMFTFLVIHKLNKYIIEFRSGNEKTNLLFQGGTREYNEVKKMSNIPQNININSNIIRWLGVDGYVKIIHSGIISLDYISNCNEDGDVAIEITDFENIGWYFDYYNSVNNIIKCHNCGNLIKKTNNKKKYCDECAEVIHREKSLENYHNNKKTCK